MGSPSAPASPNFDRPPLEEVALAVQFQPGAVDTFAAADLYNALRADYPNREEQPARPPMSEEFSTAPQPPFKFEVFPMSAMPRLWFVSETGTRLVQLQADLLAHNWRRSPAGVALEEDYPRYTRLRADLVGLLDVLARAAEGGDGLRPNWCEVTYINHIPPAAGSAERPHLNELLRGVQVPPSEGFLPSPEDVGVNLRFVIPSSEETPLGRLTVNLGTAIRTNDGVPIWVMTLTSRVRAEEETVQAALNALDIGHSWVVNGFLELTSDAMHTDWGRTE